MAGVAPVSPSFQFFDSSGNPLVSGKLYVYLAGTTTQTTTWQDKTQLTENANPIILNAAGRCTIWFDSTLTYKLELQNSAGVVQPGYPVDNVPGSAATAANVNFLQSGTGGTTRTAQDKMREWFTPEDFTGATVQQQIQRAADAALNANKPLRINKTYEITSPVYVRSGMRWEGSGKLKNTNSGGTDSDKLCLMPGNYHPTYYDELTYYNCSNTQAGDRTITTSTASHAGNFAVGDNVFVRSTGYWLSNTHQIPTYGSMNRVVSANAGTGVIVLEFPLLADITSPQIGKADNAIVDIIGTETLYCCYGAQIDGISLESQYGSALERGGFLGCKFSFNEIRSLNGIFTNAGCFSEISVNRIVCDRKVIDFAGCSVGSTIRIGASAYYKTANSEDVSLIALNEGAFGNRVQIISVGAEGYDYTRAMVLFGAANKNSIWIGSFLAPDHTGAIVQFSNQAVGGGETQYATSNNRAVIDYCESSANLQRFARFLDTGGLCDNNYVDGDFTGTCANDAVLLEGTGHVVRGKYSSSDINLSTASDCDIDAQAPSLTGYSRSTSQKRVMLNGILVDGRPNIGGTRWVAVAATNEVTPNLATNGSAQRVTYTNNAAMTVQNPADAVDGDEFHLILIANNAGGTFAPTFGAQYDLNGVAAANITGGAATNGSYFHFKAMTRPNGSLKLLLIGSLQNFT